MVIKRVKFLWSSYLSNQRKYENLTCCFLLLIPIGLYICGTVLSLIFTLIPQISISTEIFECNIYDFKYCILRYIAYNLLIFVIFFCIMDME